MFKNKTIISTRPYSSDKLFVELLKKDEAQYISLPMITTVLNDLSQEEKNIFSNLHNFDWLVFTSGNGVRYFFEHFNKLITTAILPKQLKTAVIGKTTKKELEKIGVNPTLESSGKTSIDLINELRIQIPNKSFPRILLSQGNLATSIFEEKLSSEANIQRANVYNTIAPDFVDSDTIQKIKTNNYDLILLWSPSAFYNLCKFLDPFKPNKLRFACIGPTTQKALVDEDIFPQIIAENSTSEGMYESIKNYFELKN
jgi:uroporphyrinogen-III synthase